jgi:hypothetical protein
MSAAIAYVVLVAFAIFMIVLYSFRHQIDQLIVYLEGKSDREEDAG